MSAPQRQILTDYLRPLRPLRALRAMIGLLKQAVTYFIGEAATPFSLPRNYLRVFLPRLPYLCIMILSFKFLRNYVGFFPQTCF